MIMTHGRRRAGAILFVVSALCATRARTQASDEDRGKFGALPKLFAALNAKPGARIADVVVVAMGQRDVLFVGAEAQPDELFPAGENSAEFARTASRLTEMQSAHYLQSERVQR